MAAFSDRYSLGKLVSQDASSNSYACSNRAGRTFAATLVRTQHLSLHAQRQLADDRAKIVSVKSPYLLPVREILSADGVIAIVTDPPTGPTLTVALDDGRLPASTAVGVATAVAWALQALSSQNIVHRAVRPTAILLDRGVGRVRLTGFGLSWLSDEELMRPGPDAADNAVAARYRAPEVGHGRRVTAAADVYSLGVLLYETLTGQFVPAEREARRAIGDPDRLPDGVPATLRRLIIGMLDEEPGRRPDSAVCAANLTALAPKVSPVPAAILPQLRAPASEDAPRSGARDLVLAGPISAGPISAGPISAGPISAGPISAGPISAGPISAGPISAGPISAGPIRVAPLPTVVLPLPVVPLPVVPLPVVPLGVASDALTDVEPDIRAAGRRLWPLAIGVFTLAVTLFVIVRTGSVNA